MKQSIRIFVTAAALMVTCVGRSAEPDFVFQGTPFNWVNPIPENADIPPGLHHKTFFSASMQHEVGYVIYLPPQYTEQAEQHFPVVYYLHGGRPGRENRSITLANYLYDAMLSGTAKPVIYVYVNGGVLSHYNYKPFNSMAEDLFIKELIPYIDENYRTIAHRGGRAIQGFSQGGRGVSRAMFKFPELFSSAAAGGPGFAAEKQISENQGIEEDRRQPQVMAFDVGAGNDAYTLAQAYIEEGGPKIDIALWVGTKGFNYGSTLEYMKYLDTLDIAYQVYTVGGVGHNPSALYDIIGAQLMDFHWQGFSFPGKKD